ncbi:MAG: hypothetical protein WC890_01230 [Candidatus Margulisiibacteriota bacterium]
MSNPLFRNRNLAIAALSICSAIISTVLILICFNFIFPAETTFVDKQDAFIVPAQMFHPELRERQLYFFGTSLLVLFLGGFYAFFRSHMSSENIIFNVNRASALIFVVSAVLIAAYSLINFPAVLLCRFSVYKWIGMLFLLFFAFAVTIFVSKYHKQSVLNLFAKAVAILASCVAFFFGCFGLGAINNSAVYTDHFNAVFHSMVQVHLGKYLLVDIVNLYGLYPHFLKPIFWVIGLSVLKFTIVMSIIMLLSLVFLYLFIKEYINDKLIASAGYVVIVFWCYLFSRIYSNNHDCYFQYFPIRFFFPACICYLAGRYISSKSKLIYYLSFFVATIALFWNFDTGIVVLLSWIILLIYQSLLTRNYWLVLKHLMVALAFFIGVLTLYSLYIFSFSGNIPNYASNFIYQQAYYSYGYKMIPMKFFHPWIIVYFLYLIGAFLGIKALIDRQANEKSMLIQFVSFVGFGIFVYYQGRSHDFVLVTVSYPAILLLIIYLDQLNEYLKQNKNSIYQLFNYCISFGLIFSLLFCVSSLPFAYNVIYQRWKLSVIQPNSAIIKNVNFISKDYRSINMVLIISMHSGIYSLAAGKSYPVNMPGPQELMFKKDFNQLIAFIKNSPSGTIVFYDVAYDHPEIEQYLRSDYTFIGKSPDNSIKKYVKRSRIEKK